MSDTHTASEGALTAADIESVENLLGDLELGPDNAVIEDVGELDAATESKVEAAIATSEAYDDQPVGTTAIAEPTPAAPAKTKRAKSTKEPKAKIVRDLNDLPDATFDLGTASTKADVIASRPTQKKIGEKFDNLFLSIAAGRKPSIYTMTCFNALVEKGVVTSGDLVAALSASTVGVGGTKGATYNVGTARSQAGQMMALFATAGIASRVKQTLTLNNDSPLVAKLKALAV